MISNIVESMKQFLQSHNFNSIVIVRRPVKLTKNGEESTVAICFSDRLSFSQQNQMVPLTVQIISIFALLDSWIDVNNQDIPIGGNFKNRYNRLPENNDKDLIFKELYRIFRKVRNITIHNSNSIDINQEYINFNGFNIKINTLYWLYSTVCELFSKDWNLYYSETYHVSVLRYYYDKIKKELTESGYSDDLDGGLKEITDGLRISVTVRYPVENPVCNILENSIKVRRYYCGPEQYGYKADYNISYQGNEYLIPDELLSEDDTVNKQELCKWLRK